MAFGYPYGGYPGPNNYYAPPMPDQLAQLRQNQFQQPMIPQVQAMQQPAMQNTSPQNVTSAVPPMQQGQQSTMSGPVFVNGEAGARGFMVGAGNTVMLIDADPDANTFWLKSADASGMPTMRTFDYSERISTPKAQLNTSQSTEIRSVEYVTREDFDELAKRASELERELEALKAKKAAVPKKTVKEETEDA